MKVREIMSVLASADPEAEVMTSTDLSLSRGEQRLMGILCLPTRDVVLGRFPKQEGPLSGGGFVMIVSTDVWGTSPAGSKVSVLKES